MANLGDHMLGPVIKVRTGESKDSESSVDELVLAAVVGDEACAVVAAVEFDHEASAGIVEVDSGDEPVIGVAQLGLDLWPGQT